MEGETPEDKDENQIMDESKDNERKKKHKKKKHRKGKDGDSDSEKKTIDKKNPAIIKDLIAECFVLLHIIGKGSFGQIYISYNLRDNLPVSVKKEEKKPGKTPQLKTESKIYQTLLNIQADDVSGVKPLGQDEVTGVPKFYGVGELSDCYYMIIDFLGPNLIELFNYCGCKKFTVSTVCLIALQVLNRIENIHKHHYLHRDIKPENFLIGIHEKSNVIYLIDFGLSKRYKNPKTHQHIPYREGRALTGTARYVSINTHMGIEQSRRDDLESIGYMLIYFLKGVLPWQGLKNGNEKYTRIMEKKLQIPTEILCYGLPDEITYYLKYCKSLRFEDRPDYDYLRGLFIKLLGTCNSVYGLTKEMLKFDWCFDDPATSIWNIFNKKKGGANESKYSSNITNKEKNNEEEENNNNKKKIDALKLKKQLSNIAEVNDFVSNENNPNYERSSESGDSNKSEKKEKPKKDILDKNLIKEEENESKLDESDETVRENFQPDPQDLEPGKLSESLKNIFIENPKEDNIDMYMNKLMNPAKPPIEQHENLVNLDEVEIINNNNKEKKDDKKKEKDNMVNNSLEDIKEESNKKELISSSNKASGEKNKENEEEKKSVQVNNIKNNQSESVLIEDDKEKENENSNKNSKKDKELIHSQNLIVAENNVNDNKQMEMINANSKFVTKDMENKLEKMENNNKLTFEQIHNINNYINIKDPEEKKSESKHEDKSIHNNNSIHMEAAKSLENKISEQNNNKEINNNNNKESNNNDKKEGSNGKIRQSKSNKLMKSVNNSKIQEEEEKDKSKENKNKKEEENLSYSKNFKTMKPPKKNKENFDKERKSLTPFGDTPTGEPIPKMKVSKETMIKILTEPVANFYKIEKDLGHGSYGQVKKVRHKELNEIRAMKITNKKSESSKYEIEILRKISHPNITKIFEIFSDSKKYYIIMEFLEGGELFEAITNIGSFTEASASKVMKQILSAVYYLHSNNIVHRDLKPENIMLTQKPKNGNYQIKLIDFGTAKIFRPGKKMNKFIGTSYYIAPEVLKERYDEKCDVWSCGVILFILLCGYPPFNGNNNVDIFHAIQNQNPIFGGEEWEDITSEAKDLIKLMLRKNPNERLSAEQCLQHKWFRTMENLERNKNQKISKLIQINAIQHMAKFVHENRFKQAVLQFISTQFNIQKEENDLKELFKSMDVTGTGQLSKQEFTKKLMELYGENDGKQMADTIFNSLDMDGSGKISYDEFLSAMINSQKVVTEERLKKAFKMFDKDNSGKLSVKEIRNVFGGTEAQWKQVIDEVDLNNDGEVDFEEFKTMMINMDKNQIIERKKDSEKHSKDGVSEVD